MNIIRLTPEGQLIGTVVNVDDPSRYDWGDERIEPYEDDEAFQARLAELQPQVAIPDWSQETGLAGKLFGSPLHLMLRHQAQTNGACAIALTEIMSAINGHNTALLELGLRGAIAALGASASEKTMVQGWLDECAIGVKV
ncbi:MAG: hypothetical protein HC878_03510 [Leptolyngbyaceae cyanobacterium SL_5_14]|nr:hypothetical protein [Leptolyngbyaceae cyanobacterium SL_5_14]NJO66170.1 hypothetical protein [Leptolyngbyaceae cyanobacterium RM1_405_57]